jgi:choline dehydrogenase-like flavoprotein
MAGEDRFDVVAIGSGFATSFFLRSFLATRPTLRVLVLERGPLVPHAWQTQHRKNSPVDEDDTFHNRNPGKDWRFNIGFGGSSNCWTGNVPRMLPNDFRMATAYGVGRDWPVTYDDLEPFYEEAGPSWRSPVRRAGTRIRSAAPTRSRRTA